MNHRSIKASKTKTHPIIFQEKFLNTQSNFPDHYGIYTDGSKQGMKVDFGAIFQKPEQLKCVPNESSIYRTEVTAIDPAMNLTTNLLDLSSIQTPNQFSKLYKTKIYQLFSLQDSQTK